MEKKSRRSEIKGNSVSDTRQRLKCVDCGTQFFVDLDPFLPSPEPLMGLCDECDRCFRAPGRE
jgi:hypothetical protein